MSTKRILSALLLSVLLAAQLLATEISVATMNCFLFFDPAIDHSGNVDSEDPLTPAQFTQKTKNLASLVHGVGFVGLEETGGRSEIEALAKVGGFEWGFAKGKDTYTGEEVGALYHLPAWKVTVRGRVPALDKLLSKHLYVTASQANHTVHLLVVHLIRPIGKNEEKHQAQLAALKSWATDLAAKDPKATIVVMGDTNNTAKPKGTSLIGLGSEAGEKNGYAATHLNGSIYDRIILIGKGTIKDVQVVPPPYGAKPSKDEKKVWTDHYLLKATIDIPD